MEPVLTVLITIITVLGSASAWKYYEKKLDAKRNDENFMRDDCRDRISKLEKLLAQSSIEKDDMREKILELTAQVSELRVKVEFLTIEKEKLEKKILLND